MSVVVQRQVRGQTVQKAVLVPQLPFIAGRRHPGHGSLLCGLTGSHVQVVDETVVLPQFLLVEKIVAFSEVVDIPVVAQLQIFMVLFYHRDSPVAVH